MSLLSQPHFHSEAAAIARLERIVWPDGEAHCPRCGGVDRITPVKGGRAGLRRCGPCKREFTATVGTIFERSHVKLHKWFQAAHLMASSKKGISAHQLHRTLKVTYKTAWFMEHRLREAMRDGSLSPMGGAGAIVEIDETLQGRVAGAPNKVPHGQHFNWRNIVLTLVERGGSARSFHINNATMGTLLPIIRENVSRESAVMTDELTAYKKLGDEFSSHETVNHSIKEYVRGRVTTNTVEGYFALFKRGMKGVYQHCSERHLHRYLAEFDFRYNNRVALGIADEARADKLIRGIVGKRLTYRSSSEAAIS
jgi:transposase-like protein